MNFGACGERTINKLQMNFDLKQAKKVFQQPWAIIWSPAAWCSNPERPGAASYGVISNATPEHFVAQFTVVL